MLKAVIVNGDAEGNQVRLLVLGLTDMNLAKLREGMPIAFSASEVGVRGVDHVTIVHGTNQRAIADYLRQELGVSVPDPGDLP